MQVVLVVLVGVGAKNCAKWPTCEGVNFTQDAPLAAIPPILENRIGIPVGGPKSRNIQRATARMFGQFGTGFGIHRPTGIAADHLHDSQPPAPLAKGRPGAIFHPVSQSAGGWAINCQRAGQLHAVHRRHLDRIEDRTAIELPLNGVDPGAGNILAVANSVAAEKAGFLRIGDRFGNRQD